MVMIPINHAAPLLLSPDNVGPGMTLNCYVIKLTMGRTWAKPSVG